MAKRKSPVRSRTSKLTTRKSRSTPKTVSRASTSKRKPRASRALAPKPKKSASHVRGWETRRANERSRRAIKGWETRRKRERKKRVPSKPARATNLREYQASVRYTRKHGASTGHSGTLQGSVLAPIGTPASDLRQALLDYIKGKKPAFDVSAVEWRSRVR